MRPMEFPDLESAKRWVALRQPEHDVRVSVGQYVYTLHIPRPEQDMRRAFERANRIDRAYTVAGWALMALAVVLVAVILWSIA